MPGGGVRGRRWGWRADTLADWQQRALTRRDARSWGRRQGAPQSSGASVMTGDPGPRCTERHPVLSWLPQGPGRRLRPCCGGRAVPSMLTPSVLPDIYPRVSHLPGAIWVLARWQTAQSALILDYNPASAPCTPGPGGQGWP